MEEELSLARSSNGLLRAEAAAARAAEAQLRARREQARRGDQEFTGQLGAAAERAESTLTDAAVCDTQHSSVIINTLISHHLFIHQPSNTSLISHHSLTHYFISHHSLSHQSSYTHS